MRPPRYSRALLTICTAPADRESLHAELDGEFSRLALQSLPAARRWYRRQARRSMGPLLVERVRQAGQRARDPYAILSAWRSDSRQAIRGVWRHKRITAAVVTTLGVALGGAFAVATVVDAVLLQPLPFPASDRIVVVWNTGPKLPASVRAVSFQDLEDWRRSARSLDALSGFTPVSHTLTGRGEPRRIEGMRVARDFERVLGVRMILGRALEAGDFTAAAPPIVLTAPFWRREFGGRTDVVGQILMLDERPRAIVGVVGDMAMPYPTAPHDFWTPLAPRAGAPWEASRATGWLNAIGRLGGGVAMQDAEAELSAIARTLAGDHPASNGERQGVALRPLKDDLVAPSRPAVWLVMAAVGALLLVAYGNVVHLLVAHVVVRRREFSVRHALGASSIRLVRHVGIEASILGLAAVTLGLAIAPGLLRILSALPASALPRQDEIAMGAAVRWMPGLLALTTLVIAWPHARLASRASSPVAAATRIAGQRGDRRVRHLLIGGQVALSVVLLLAGTLLVRTLVALESVETGFSSAGVLTLQATPSRALAPSAAATMQFHRSALAAIRGIPGVEAVSASTAVPFVLYGWSFSLSAADTAGERRLLVRVNVASPGFFDALRVPILSGRPMTEDEQRGGADVVVISRSVARLLFGGADAVGRTLDYSGRGWTIVGVVPDLRQRRLEDPDAPEIYLPWHNAGQRPQAIVVRAPAPTAALRDLIAERLRAIDPGVTLADVAALEDRVRATLAPQRFRALLLATLASAASLLAIFGVYSVTAFAVATQAREQAIRVALGETRDRAQRRVVGGSVRPALAGAALGTAVAWIAGRFVEAFLFEVRADDPWLLTIVPIALLACTLLAAWIPAARAARFDLAAALRDDRERV
jgi:predicted permease